ncbi:MAG: DUF1697 domain-containing protein [bacterium]|nr:DUF1697 domain-containing protein [bacterium]MDN5835396.1 DUF1697 domain-containing protein [bacterium]
MRYVALLRGVNVGGNHRLPKQAFQQVLESLGLRDVVVYLNSGNAVFTSDSAISSSTVQAALEAQFKFPIPTLVLPGDKVQAIASAIPDDWTNDTSGSKSDVIYLFDDINTADITTKLGYKPEIEIMNYVDGAVVTSISRANQGRGSLQKLVGTKLYAQVTIRNINTARKLAELVG